MRTRFWYGSDGQRYKREDGSKRTLYFGNVEIVTDAGATTFKRTIAGVMLQTVVGATAANDYLFHDQLGNLVRITNASGTVVNRQDHAPFGVRRVSGEVPRVSREVRRVSRDVRRVSREVPQVSREVRWVSREVRQVSREVRWVSREVRQVSRDVRRVSREVWRVSRDVQRVS